MGKKALSVGVKHVIDGVTIMKCAELSALSKKLILKGIQC